jgi:membrane-associated protease RseP (regulator of RpoE activity)
MLLLAMSVVTTTAIGARFMQNFQDGLPAIAVDSDLWPWPWLFAQPSRFQLGWPFSFALLGILLTHEFGHYIACRVHGIRTTLPLVLPAPTLSGTAGAVIQIRTRVPSRRKLMDVGIYGPIAGYLASILAVSIGLLLSRSSPVHATSHPSEIIVFGQPLTLRLIHELLHRLQSGVPPLDATIWHPVLIAGWVGLFITALNLIPGGQLDGGHILYALSPQWHKRITRILPAALLLCGLFFWIGWILWGLLLLVPAMRHPRVPIEEPLDGKRILLGWIALAIFLLTFSAQPFLGSSALHYLHR